MKTLKKSTNMSFGKSTSVENHIPEENYINWSSEKTSFIDDEDEFDMPLDDLETLDNFDSDDDDDY